jgi:CubicO group peptidase (beta-lactamase class C family)
LRENAIYGRRDFLSVSGLYLGRFLLRYRSQIPSADLDDFIYKKMERNHIPGLAAAIVRQRQVRWSKGYGWASLDPKIKMTADTLQNIGSISKTFVGTAVMQLRDQGALQLDDNIDKHLDFSVHNPKHAHSPITFRQLMTHRSSIADGSAYARGYGCGDSPISLRDWIKGYFIAGGAFYKPEENFHPWAPGEKGEYNNVAFGLLAYLVEVISGLSFSEYCRQRVFQPLGMNETSWYLADINIAHHAVPYSYVTRGVVRGPSWGGSAQGVIGASEQTLVADGYAANCLYNHPNYPDGFLRTSVHQLAHYLLAYVDNGSLKGRRILAEGTVAEMLRPLYPEVDPNIRGLRQGLVWHGHDGVWGHSGGDPGINTLLNFNPSSGSGVIIFVNTWGAELDEVGERLLKEIDSL